MEKKYFTLNQILDLEYIPQFIYDKKDLFHHLTAEMLYKLINNMNSEGVFHDDAKKFSVTITANEL